MLIQRPNSAALCSHCTDILPLLIDISPTPKLGNAHSEWWNNTYGKTRSIQGLVPTTCELCRILHKAFARAPGFDVASTKIGISNYSLVKYKNLEHNACSFGACGVQLVLAPGLPIVTTDDGELVQAFTGRFVLQLMNPSLAKHWLASCEKHPVCKPDYSSRDFDFPFRLIDVEEGRLVEAPKDARYVALSYVWGGVKQVMLNKTTRPYLEQHGSITPGGLKRPEDEYSQVKETMQAEERVIPRTIRDAIRLCQSMSERYLWTDSLCIMQDDEFQTTNGAWSNTDKMAQIPKMDIIYGASILTIIAACGTDSNAGLPGVHPSSMRTTQTVGKIGDQIFVSIDKDPMEAFWRSKWCERAWTFQEFLLSKRHLIFLPDRAIFHCHTLSWSEDHSLEFVDKPKDTLVIPAWTRSYRLLPLQLPDRSRWSEEIFFPAIFINQYFNQWLKNFLKRRLTVSSDILFAFEGALSASRRHLGKFHHGLPVTYFCECLLWSVGTSSMYIGKDPHQGLTKRREGFPSWSWTGWMWDVADFEEFHINYAGKVPEHWCRVAIWGTRLSVNKDVELWQMTAPNIKGWERLNFFSSPAFQVDDAFVTKELPTHLEALKKTSLPMNCLLIKSLTSSIFVSSRTTEYSFSSPAIQAFSSSDYVLENRIGVIHLPKTWQTKIEHGLELQVVITGSFFRGPDTRFPDQTDEHNPSIQCLVVQQVGNMLLERVATLVTNFEMMKKLGWKPIVALLQ
jgi:hypothetical protein